MTKAIVVMGVSGSGKSTVAEGLAEKLGIAFIEGDKLHPKSNVDKMSEGIPLTDDDRWPWLDLTARQRHLCSNTSSTSSNGTILISDLSSRRPRPRDLAMVYPLLLSVLVNA